MVRIDAELEETIASSPIDTISGPFYVLQLAVGEQPPLAAVSVFWDQAETTAIVGEAALQGQFGRLSPATGKEGPFSLLRLRVARPFVARGFLAAATSTLAAASINVYVVSTFTFDFILVRADQLDRSVEALAARGFPVGEVLDDW